MQSRKAPKPPVSVRWGWRGAVWREIILNMQDAGRFQVRQGIQHSPLSQEETVPSNAPATIAGRQCRVSGALMAPAPTS